MKRAQTKKPMDIADLAVKAMREAVAAVVKAHEKEGRPLHIWEGGKIVSFTPGKPKVSSSPSPSPRKGDAGTKIQLE